MTKRDLIRHYGAIAPVRCSPTSSTARQLQALSRRDAGTKGFWQKALPTHAPEWMRRWRNDEADPGETEEYSVLDSTAALAWLANCGVLEIHAWTSTIDAPHQPTWAMIDIDPGTSTTWDDMLTLATLHRTALDHLGVAACPKVSGRRGIQIWVPVRDALHVRPDAGMGRTTLADHRRRRARPRELGMADRASPGLARLDYTQNAINKTLVTPFSTRAAPGAPVSVPITWDELDDPDLRSDRWTIRTIGDRLAAVGDPLAGLIGRQQVLPDLS